MGASGGDGVSQAGKTSLLMASRPDWVAQVVTAPSGTVSATVGGALYLDHPTAALSLLDQVAAFSGVSSCVLRRDGKVSITLSSAGVLTWGAATTLRDLLGFTGDRTSATTHVADTVSPLLWVPMREEQQDMGIVGSEGARLNLVSRATNRQGYSTTVWFGQHTQAMFSWSFVTKARFWTLDQNPGEWYGMFNDYLVKGHRFILYRGVDMDDASGSAATYSAPLGPYQLAGDGSMSVPTHRSKGFAQVDRMFDVDLPCVKVPEYA